MMIETQAKVFFNQPLSEFFQEKDFITLDLDDFWIKRTELRERYTFKQELGDLLLNEKCNISEEEFLELVGCSKAEGYEKIKQKDTSLSDDNIKELFLVHNTTRTFFKQLEVKNNTINNVTLVNIELW